MAHSDIISKVQGRFEDALKSGDLLYFPSTISKHEDSGVQYEIRLCPALQHKPPLPTPHFNGTFDGGVAAHGAKGKVYDPFAAPRNSQLLVGELKDEETQEEFVVLLNKYAVVKHHFLLVTKEFKSQTAPLMPSELVQTYLLLVAARKSGTKFFSFYNCGDNSGASQPHKHIQFVPLDDQNGPPIDVLARQVPLEFPDRPFSLSRLSYASHSFRFPSGMESFPPDQLEATLANAFVQVLDLAISTIRHDPEYPAGSPSYNVIITLEHLHIIPRRKENHILSETGDKLSVNSLAFAGMMLVKSDVEMEGVKRETISKILRDVSLESVHDIQVHGTSLEPPLAGR